MAEVSEELARRKAKYLTGLLWHLGAFVILNAFFFLLDLALGQEGLQWAYWITIFWGLGLAFHVLAWLVAGRQVEERKTREYLDEAARHQGPRP